MSDHDDLPQQDRLTTLKARAAVMGVTYHPSISADKLAEKLAAVGTPETPAPASAPVEVAPSAQESAAQERQRLKKEAHELIRIRLTCMNPAKKDHPGELFTVGNGVVGSVTKFIPFNADEGWHVPRILLEQLQARQCQVFTTLKAKNGVAVRQGKLIKEFAIEILPPLTAEEIHDLAQRQAMSGAVD